MYLKYGNYQHAANEAAVVISKQRLFSEAGIPHGLRERWDIQGRLQAADPAAVSVAIDALTAAYAVQGQDVGFYFDDGQPTSHRIDSARTNGGVRVIAPPSFPHGQGAEYSTFRNYVVALEAEWLEDHAGLLAWQEIISLSGGGPQCGYLQPIAGPPVKQLLRQATTFRAVQSGHAIGYQAYPLPAAPLWPAAEHVHRRELRYDPPRRMGPAGQARYTQFRINWTYHFEDAGPLWGLPTAWPE